MRKSISSRCSVSMRHLALMGMLGTGSLQAHAQNSAIEFVTVYNGPKLGGGSGTSTRCPLPPPPQTDINLPPEPSIAVGQHWIVLAVNYSVFVYRRSDLIPNSDPTISCSPVDLPQQSHGAYKVTDIIQRFMPGAVGCGSQACDCVNVNVPFGSGNHGDSTVYDVQIVYNPHKAEFAMITGAERQFFLSDGDDPYHRPFCGPACGSISMDFELVRKNTSNTDIFHRSWLGFDSENYYISHRDGSNGVQLYQLDATTHSVVHSTTAPLTSCPRGIAAVTSYDSNHEVQYPFVGLPGGNGGSPIFFGFDTNGAVVQSATSGLSWSGLRSVSSAGCSLRTGSPNEVFSAVLRNGVYSIVHSGRVDTQSSSENLVMWHSYQENPPTFSFKGEGSLTSTPDVFGGGSENTESDATFPSVTINSMGQIGFVYTSVRGTASGLTQLKPVVAVGFAEPCNGNSGARLAMNRSEARAQAVRWGDYAGACPDPLDPYAMWFATMYLHVDNPLSACVDTAPAWNTKFGSFTALTPCDIDFNNDGVFPDTLDVDDFISVFSGGPCSTGCCDGIDFNGDGVFPDSLDSDLFVEVFGGGSCR